MLSSQDPRQTYAVRLHRAVAKFLRTHHDLNNRWDGIVEQIKQNPRRVAHIDHLKGDWHCSYRWDEGSYRIKYDVNEDDIEIYFYDANNRGDVYKGLRGSSRRE